MKGSITKNRPLSQHVLQTNLCSYARRRAVRARVGLTSASNRATPWPPPNTDRGRPEASESIRDNDFDGFDGCRDASQAFEGPSVSGSSHGRQGPYTSSQGFAVGEGDAWAGAGDFDAPYNDYFQEDRAYAGQAQWSDRGPWGDGATWESERWARRTEKAPDDTLKWLGGGMAVAAVVLVAGQWIAEHPIVLLPPLFLFFFTPLGERLATPQQPSMSYTRPDNEPWYDFRDDVAGTASNAAASSKPEADSWSATTPDDPELPAYKSPANKAWAAAQLAARRATERAAASLDALDEEIGFRGSTFWRDKSAWASDAPYSGREGNAAAGNTDAAGGPVQAASSGARGEESGFGRRFSKAGGGGSPSRSPVVAPVSALSVSASSLYLPTGGAADASAVGKTVPGSDRQATVEVVEPEEIIAPDDFAARRRAQPAAARWQVLKQRLQSQAGANAGRYRSWKRSQRAQATASAASAHEYGASQGLAVRPVRQRVTAAQMARGGAIQRTEAWQSRGLLQQIWGDPATRSKYINTVRATRQPVVNALLKLFPWLRSWGGLL